MELVAVRLLRSWACLTPAGMENVISSNFLWLLSRLSTEDEEVVSITMGEAATEGEIMEVAIMVEIHTGETLMEEGLAMEAEVLEVEAATCPADPMQAMEISNMEVEVDPIVDGDFFFISEFIFY